MKMAMSTTNKVLLVVVVCASFMSTQRYEANAQFELTPEILEQIPTLLKNMPKETIAQMVGILINAKWDDWKPTLIAITVSLKPYFLMMGEGHGLVPMIKDLAGRFIERLPGILNDSRTQDLVATISREMRKVNFTQLNGTSFLSTAIRILNTVDTAKIWSKIRPFIDPEDIFPRPESVDEVCYKDIILTFNKLLDEEEWALKMLDSIGWPGPGLLRSKLYMPGSSSQCRSVQATSNSTGVMEAVFQGKYCRSKVGIPKRLMDIMGVRVNETLKLTMGMCVPDTCQSTDIASFLPTDLMAKLEFPLFGVMCTGDIDGPSNVTMQAEEMIDNLFRRIIPLMNDPRILQVVEVISREIAKLDLTSSANLRLRRGANSSGAIRQQIDPSDTLSWSTWYNRDNSSGDGDNEELRLQAHPVPCKGAAPVAIQVRELVDSSWRNLLTTDVNIHVGPAYGLVCQNNENAYRECRGIRVRHSITKGGFWFRGPWFDRDGATGTGDSEPGYDQSEKLWAAEGTGVSFETIPESRTTSHRDVEQLLHVGANYGLVCLNQQNLDLGLGACRDYSVRYLCP